MLLDEISGSDRKIKKLVFISLNFLMLLLAMPFAVIMRLLSPIRIIRLISIDVGRIGGAYLGDLYLSEKKCGNHHSKYKDIFYFDFRGPKKNVNKQWMKMWKREINILFFSGFAQYVDRTNRFFPGYEKYQLNYSDPFPTAEECINYLENKDFNIYKKYNRHLKSILKVNQPNLSFTLEENELGIKYLKKIGIPNKASFICFHNRDSAYLNTIKDNHDWSYHDFRDSSVENYLSAAEEMISQGYYAVRIGSITKEKIKVTNPKLIDYANSGMRTDFLDIYLSDKCRFIICSNSGISFPAEVFKKPLVYVNWTNPRTVPVYSKKGLVIFKKFYLKSEKRFMTFLEIINLKFGGSNTNQIFSDLGLEIIENTPEEIRTVTIEMDERLNGTWESAKGDEELQQSFWDLFGKEKLKSPNFHIGADYLRNNKDLLK
jgi:putative glycosyltransferase (TIGR04372 family)